MDLYYNKYNNLKGVSDSLSREKLNEERYSRVPRERTLDEKLEFRKQKITELNIEQEKIRKDINQTNIEMDNAYLQLKQNRDMPVFDIAFRRLTESLDRLLYAEHMNSYFLSII
jgi:hypothetical protein